MNNQRPSALPDDDVVELLICQHGLIHNLFDEVRAADAGTRREAFDRLVRMLAVHETADEIAVHPFARTAVPGGHHLVDDRLAEEKSAPGRRSRGGRLPGAAAGRRFHTPVPRSGLNLLRKKVGQRYALRTTPLEPSCVRGTHGRRPDTHAEGPVLLCSDDVPGVVPEWVEATAVRDLVLIPQGLPARTW